MAEFTFDANNFLKVTSVGSGGGGSNVDIFDSAGNSLTSTAGSLNVNVTNTSPTAGTLSNNTAAPIADNVGVLPAVANAAPPTWTEGFQVLLSEDLSGNLRTITGSGSTTAVTGNVTVVQPTGTNLHVVIDSTSGTAAENLIQVAGVTLGATAVTAFGTAPAAANVPGVNASLFSGTTALTNTAGSLNVNVTNSSGSTVTGTKANNSVVPGSTNLGVLPGIANAATQTWTEGDQVLESMDLSGRQRVRGTIAHNTQAPDATGQMCLTELANAVAPTYTEGDLVLGSVDLSGNRRIIGTKTNNNAAPGTQVGVLPALANAANPSWTEGFQVLESVDLSGRQRIMGQVPADTAFTGSPVVVAGVDAAGNVQELPVVDAGTAIPAQTLLIGGADVSGGLVHPLSVNTNGVIATVDARNAADAISNTLQGSPVDKNGTDTYLPTWSFVFNGTTWDRTRSAGIGNAAAATGIAASAAYGEYLTTAPAPANAQYSALQTDYAGSLFTKPIRRSTTKGSSATITNSAVAVTIMPAQAAGIFADISNLVATVTSAATVSLPFTLTLSDGTASYVYDMVTGALATSPADGTVLALAFNPPLPATTAATAWTIATNVATVVVHAVAVAVLQKAS
jgi:hypothetical protein